MDVKQLLAQSGFRFEKKFGQNFLLDGNLLASIVQSAGVGKDDVVLEVGAGAGTLTRQLSCSAKKVIAFEIDKNLEKILAVTTAECNNVQIVMGDVMKIATQELEKYAGGCYKVVANIPYYITTPLLMKFIDQGTKVTSLTLTIQKEVADRLCAEPCTKDYGAITVAVQGVAKVSKVVDLPKELFYPMPNVDSAVVRIDIDRARFNICDKAVFDKTVKGCFAMRRKTLYNNLASAFGFDKATCDLLLGTVGSNGSARGETLSVEQFVGLSNAVARLLAK